MWSQPTSSPARSTSSTNAVPGSTTVPQTAWSASHGCARSDSLPVSRARSPSATGTAAPSSGWSATCWPTEVASPAGAGGLQPVALPLEGIGGQVDLPAAGQRRRPVDGCAVHPGRGHRVQQPVGPAVVAAQRAQHDGLGLGVVDALLHAHRQHRMRADLEEDLVARGQQRRRHLSEVDGSAQALVPVLGVQVAVVDPLAGHRGQERHPRPSRRDVAEHVQQPLVDRFDVVGVRGVVHRDPPGPHAGLLAVRDEVGQRRRVAGHDDRAGTVHRGDADPAVPARQVEPVLRGADRDHAALAGQGEQLAAAQRDDPGGVVQRQRAADARGGDLALGVPDHHVGPHAVRVPHRGERDDHREHRGLHHVDALQRGRVVEHVEQRPVRVPGQGPRALRHPGREDLGRAEELARHADPLRALAGEDEHHPRVGAGDAGDRVVAEQDRAVRQQSPAEPGRSRRRRAARPWWTDGPAAR